MTMTTLEHPLVADYLARLRAQAARLPAAQGADLVADIEEHLAAALPADAAPDDRHVVEVLDRLGDPADVVAAAAGETGGVTALAPAAPVAAEPRPSATRPVAAVILLASAGLFGIVFPVAAVCWIVGLVLFLTSSSVWTRRTARIGGAILIPYFLITPGLIVVEFTGLAFTGTTTCDTSGSGTTCTTKAPWPAAVFAILLLVYIVAGIVTAVILAVRALRASRAVRPA